MGHTDALGSSRTLLEAWLEQSHLLPAGAERIESANPSPELEATFKPFWETWAYVNREYYDENAVDTTKLSRGAVRGMLATLDDPYSVYLDPVHREMSEADLRGAFDGIGVQVEMVEDRLRVVSPLEGSSGERAGLQPGDLIFRVDGSDIKGMNLADSIRLIRGPRGTTVILTIQRGDRPLFDVNVTREEIRVSAVRGEVRPDGIAYIRITNFTQRVGAELRQTLDRLSSQNKRAWVLDLRGNPGGYLDGAVAVASEFLDDKVVLYEQRRGDDREEIRTRGQAHAATGPMVVLVDKGTASASEIVAAALADNGRATLVGEQTFGKGLVQLVHRLSDGSALRLTVARWLTPQGTPIQGVGLAPSIPVAAVAGTDAVLQSAVDYLRDQPRSAQADSPPSMSSAQPSELVPAAAHQMPDPDDSAAPVVMLDSAERAAGGPVGLV